MEGKGPRETLLQAVESFEREGRLDAPVAPLAVDLGCGQGADVAELLRRGWRVLAVDSHPEAIARLVARPDIEPTGRLTIGFAPLEAVEIPACDLVNASFSLPFCDPEHFGLLWSRIIQAIVPGGRFAGQLFGDRDSWATIPGRSHHARAEATRLLEELDLEQFDEQERDSVPLPGHPAKHWHIFHIIARRPRT